MHAFVHHNLNSNLQSLCLQYPHPINHETTWRRTKTTMRMLGIHHQKMNQTVLLQRMRKKTKKMKKNKNRNMERLQNQSQLSHQKSRKQRKKRKMIQKQKFHQSNHPKKNPRSCHIMAQVNRMRLKRLWKRKVLVMVIQAFECGGL